MRIGIDLGGTKIEGIAIDSAGQEIARKRIPTPTGDYERTLEAVCDLVSTLDDHGARKGTVGVGIPGTVSPKTGLIKNANSTCLIGRALDRDLQDRLRRPVRIANDANCFAISEATDGAGRGFDVVLGVILGTGVGSGLAIDGRIHTGINAIGGEWGHNSLPWPKDAERPGPACYCGKFGCIETFLSGPALQSEYASATGNSFPVDQIAQRATIGDHDAESVLARYEERLARSLATVINIVDPDVIVLGGGLSNLDRLYSAVPALWQAWVFSDYTETPLRKNRHGDSSGVRGAAWLWPPDTD